MPPVNDHIISGNASFMKLKRSIECDMGYSSKNIAFPNRGGCKPRPFFFGGGGIYSWISKCFGQKFLFSHKLPEKNPHRSPKPRYVFVLPRLPVRIWKIASGIPDFLNM